MLPLYHVFRLIDRADLIRVSLIRQETEDQVDGLQDQIDAFQKIIDLKKESLSASKDEEDYQTEVAKRVKEIADKQAKLAQLERDTSASAQAEKAKLAEELAELQNGLSDYQSDYSYNAQVDALDKQGDAYEESKNDEIKELESAIDTEEKLYNEAISRIDGDWNQLYDDLIEWNRQYGDMIDGEDSITSAWKTAKTAAEEYGSVVSALDGIKGEISNQGQSTNTQAQIDNIVTRMAANGKAHHTATPEEKKRLVKANEDMAVQLSELLGRPVVKDTNEGVWYLDKIGGVRLFHTGLEEGYVGANQSGKDEVLSVLKKGELVFTKDQYMKTFNSLKYGITGVLDTLMAGLSRSSPAVSEVLKTVTNNTDNSTDGGDIKLENHFHLQGEMTKDNMEQFADMCSTHTVNKLSAASRRKGLRNGVGNSMLRG